MAKIHSTVWRSKADDRNLLSLEGNRILVPVHEVSPQELQELADAIDELLSDLRLRPDLHHRLSTQGTTTATPI